VAEELVAASNRRTNTSSRLPAEHYYDDRSIELVRNRERLIVDEYGYSPPGIARPAA